MVRMLSGGGVVAAVPKDKRRHINEIGRDIQPQTRIEFKSYFNCGVYPNLDSSGFASVRGH